MKTFLITMAIVLLLIGFAAMTVPVEAQLGFPATLTPFPTFVPGDFENAAQATLAQTLTDTIWWENAPFVDLPNPRPGFVMYTIQWWNWINDTTSQVIMYSMLLLIVILLALRLAHRFRTLYEKLDGAGSSGSDVTVKLDSSDVNAFRNRR